MPDAQNNPKASNNKARSLRATVVALLFAGLYFLAQQLGLIDPGDPDHGSGEGAGAAVAESEPTGSGPDGSGIPFPKPPLVVPESTASQGTATDTAPARPATAPAFDAALGLKKVANAFDKQLNDVILGVEGEVVRLLPDDDYAPRHQLFLLELANDITLKVSHNIDQAPYIPLERGDTVRVFGEYEWNEKGGVLHWTHLAHGGNHPDGYIEHEGRFYQ